MAWQTGWSGRVKITIDPTKVGGADLADFPVYVKLADMPAAFWSDSKADLSDVMITTEAAANGASTYLAGKLPRDIVYYVKVSTTGELYFKAPAISSSVNTVFYLYYGNAGASEVNSSDVWSSDYLLVAHCASTSDSANGYVATNSNVGSDTTPNGGPAWSYVRASPSTSQWNNPDGGASWTITSWMKVPTGSVDYTLFGINDGYPGFRERGSNSYRVIQPGGTSTALFLTNIRADSGWHRISVAFDTTGNTYLVTADGTSSEAITLNDSGAALVDLPLQSSIVFGTSMDLNATRAFTGSLGGIRVSNVARSGAWLTADANNQVSPSTFYALEDIPPASGKTRYAMFVW